MELIDLNGKLFPAVGFGAFEMDAESAEKYVSDALSMGYRIIETSQLYDNEEGVGNAIRRSGIPREEIYVIDKVFVYHESGRYDATRENIDKSLMNLGLDYIDFMFPHQTVGNRYEANCAIGDAIKEGKVKGMNIGDFNPDIDIDRIKENQGGSLYELDLEDMNWSPTSYPSKTVRFCNETVREIANRYHKCTGQIVLRYLNQLGFVPIIRATTKEHIRMNLDIFDFNLTEKEMNDIQLSLQFNNDEAIISDRKLIKMFDDLRKQKN